TSPSIVGRAWRSSFAVSWRAALPTTQFNQPVSGAAGEQLADAIRPGDEDRLEPCGRAQSKMGRRRTTTEVALRRIDRAQLLPLSGADAHLRAVGVAFPLRIERPHLQPVSSLGRYVPQQANTSANGGYQKIRRAVVVEVAASQTATDVPETAQRRVRRRPIAECPRAVVDEKLVTLGVGFPEAQAAVSGGTAANHAAIDNREIDDAIVVEIGQQRTEPRAVTVGRGQPRWASGIAKFAARTLLPKRVCLAAEM